MPASGGAMVTVVLALTLNAVSVAVTTAVPGEPVSVSTAIT
jgi:hypothetical protein